MSDRIDDAVSAAIADMANADLGEVRERVMKALSFALSFEDMMDETELQNRKDAWVLAKEVKRLNEELASTKELLGVANALAEKAFAESNFDGSS